MSKIDHERSKIQEEKKKAVNISITALSGTLAGTKITQIINPAYKYQNIPGSRTDEADIFEVHCRSIELNNERDVQSKRTRQYVNARI